MKLKFKAGARLIYQLGNELIPNEMIALLELVKNSYDADATIVDIIVDTKIVTPYGVGKITVKDNGNGMTPSIIDKAFMKLASSMKVEKRISPYFKRRVLGNKGIGRLAMQRLGRYVKLSTVPRIDRLENLGLVNYLDKDEFIGKYSSVELELDWNVFLEYDNFFDVGVELLYKGKNDYGTSIEIFGLTDIGFWELNQVKKNSLKKQILEMTNIYENHEINKFNIKFDIDNEIISNEAISEDLLKDSADVYSDIKFSENKLMIKTYRHKKYLLDRVKNCLKLAELKGFDVSGTVDLTKIYNKYKYDEVIIDFRNLLNSYDIVPWLNKIKLESLSNDTIAYPGDFSGALYANQRNENSFKFIIENKLLADTSVRTVSELKSIWNKSNGVYLFRDAFRILPYGDREWLGFTEYSQRQKNIIYKEHTVSGYFVLEGNTTENILEQTNRMGIVENQYGRNLFILLKDVIGYYLSKLDQQLRDDFIPKVKNDMIYITDDLIEFKVCDIKYDEDNVEEIVEDIKTDLNNEKVVSGANILERIELSHLNQKVDKLVHVNKVIKKRYKQESSLKETELESIKEIYPLVSQGIIVQTLSHELNRIYVNIKYSAKKIKTELYKDKPDKSILKKRINAVINNAEYIRTSLNHLYPLSDKDVDLKKTIMLKDFLSNVYKPSGLIYDRLKRNNIIIAISGDEVAVQGNKGLILTIFDNLVLNSEYWLGISSYKSKRIDIKVFKDGSVIFFDNGHGVSKDIEEILFEPFVSNKPKEEKRGLGLYISKELAEMMSGGLELLKERNKEGRYYKFRITFKLESE